MKEVHSATPRASSAFIAFSFLLALCPAASSQKNRPNLPPPTRPPEASQPRPEPSTSVRTFEQANLELQLLLASRSRELDLERERRRTANQLARDLQRLEELETEQIGPECAAAMPDYRNIAAATNEIKDRAIRIKYNVPLPLKKKTNDTVEHKEDPGNFQAMLPELSRAIKSFLRNPVLRLASPNDAELRSNAGRDLDSIIRLSKTINKLAKKLSKAPVPPA